MKFFRSKWNWILNPSLPVSIIYDHLWSVCKNGPFLYGWGQRDKQPQNGIDPFKMRRMVFLQLIDSHLVDMNMNNTFCFNDSKQMLKRTFLLITIYKLIFVKLVFIAVMFFLHIITIFLFFTLVLCSSLSVFLDCNFNIRS